MDSGEPTLSCAVLVDVCHLVLSQIESHAQVFGAQHIVEIGHSSKVFGYESPVEGIESFYPFVFFLDVSLHESHVGCQMFEERAGKGTAQDSDPNMRILLRKGVNHGHSHGHIAHGRKADNEDMFCFHSSIDSSPDVEEECLKLFFPV